MSGDFEPEQKRYLEGFVAGLQIAKNARPAAGGAAAASPAAEPTGPDAAGLRAQDRVIKSGGKSSIRRSSSANCIHSTATRNSRTRPRRTKRRSPTIISAGASSACSTARRPRNPICAGCAFRTASSRIGSSQVSPISPSAMPAAIAMSPRAPICRCARSSRRTPSPWSKASRISASRSRGSGADNIRNVTGTPTAGIDPQELIDTRPYAREWHFHILNDRSLYGMPRKFNVGFDGGGTIAVLEDTNDIGFQAVEVKDGFGVEPGVWFRLLLGGITGHQDFARDTGIIVKPAEATHGGGRGGARVHRQWRPHQSCQGAAQICARRMGLREIPQPRWKNGSAASSPACRPKPSRRVRFSTGSPISASTRRSRRA